jgi:hypothetical protein
LYCGRSAETVFGSVSASGIFALMMPIEFMRLFEISERLFPDLTELEREELAQELKDFTPV